MLTELSDILNSRFSGLPCEARRLFHGRGRCYEGLEQLTVDWLKPVLLVSIFKEQEDSFYASLSEMLLVFASSPKWKEAGGEHILVQHRDRIDSPSEVVVGSIPEQLEITENGLTFLLDIGKRQNNGLFLDMRFGRKWVMANSQNKRVLNLFAYTCGFSVAAIQGGAQKVVNLDMAKSSLARGRDNHRLNAHDLSKVSFMGHDIFKSWGKLRKNGPYDLVVIDPPSFQKGSFVLTKDYAKILRRLPELVAENGEVLACVNAPDVGVEFLLEQMKEQAPEFAFVCRLENPPEFEDISDQSALKVMHFVRG
nr:class I SAM-dependent methyltransferase [Veronia nyctiphanis]